MCAAKALFTAIDTHIDLEDRGIKAVAAGRCVLSLTQCKTR
jgi:hypothetical protein